MSNKNEVTEILEIVLKMPDSEKRNLLLIMKGMELQNAAMQLQAQSKGA